MSYDEYSELFDKAQKKDTKYVAFVFDIKNSKKYLDFERYVAQVKTFETINLMIKKIKALENSTNKKILIDEPMMTIVDNVHKTCNFPIINNPWFVSGDSFAFFCYNNKISKKDFVDCFKQCCVECKNKYPYHFMVGKFETLDYKEGLQKYYVGYVIQECTENKKHINHDEIINM